MFNYTELSKKNIAILGSTGSVGTQALEVIGENPSLFYAYVLTAQNNAELLIQQALKFNPAYAIICNERFYPRVKEALASTGVKVLAGIDAIKEIGSKLVFGNLYFETAIRRADKADIHRSLL